MMKVEVVRELFRDHTLHDLRHERQVGDWTVIRGVSSVEGMPAFFNSGVTIACRCEVGSRPCTNEALIITVRNGSSRSTSSRIMNVGTGSRVHDFTGDLMMMRRTSSSVNDEMTTTKLAPTQR
jgi:hypothetical protein